METNLIIFLKAPRRGTVKTRLAKFIGEAAACSAYQTLVTRLIENLHSLPEVELRFSPDDAGPEIRRWLQNHWWLRPQGLGDLGQRLQRAFQESFDSGAKRVVTIGSDCPAIVAEDIQMAWSALATHDVVLGPASDGGYWLIGMRAIHAELFEKIPWSTEAVLATTLSRIREKELSCHVLRELSDVDLREDWEKFLKDKQHEKK